MAFQNKSFDIACSLKEKNEPILSLVWSDQIVASPLLTDLRNYFSGCNSTMIDGTYES